MKILRTSGDLTPKDIYLLTMSPKTAKMKDHKDERLELDAWLIYEDVNKTGELQTILAIKTPEGETFATNSPTFLDDFEKMIDMFTSMGATVPAVTIISGTSKAGREFITCAYSD